MLGFGPPAPCGNPQTFSGPPNQLPPQPTLCARPPTPVEYLPHIAAVQHRFLPPSGAGPPMYPGNISAQCAPRPPNQPTFLDHPVPRPAYPATFQILPPNNCRDVQVSAANQQCPPQVQCPPAGFVTSTSESRSAMEPQFPVPSSRTRPLRNRPVTCHPFAIPVPVAVLPFRYAPPERYPPPTQQQALQQQNFTPQAGQYPPTSIPYQPRSYPTPSPYHEPGHVNGQAAANCGPPHQNAAWVQEESWEVTELKKSLYRDFAALLANHGAMGERDQPVLGLFMGMATEARQLIKECGGVKSFLLQDPQFSEDDGKIKFVSISSPAAESNKLGTVSSMDSGKGSYESTVSSRPFSSINPNAAEFVPSEGSYSEASSDDVFVECETYSAEEPDTESAFKEIASAYGIKVTRPEDYSLEDISVPVPQSGPCELVNNRAGNMGNGEAVGGMEHSFEATWVTWDEPGEDPACSHDAGDGCWQVSENSYDQMVVPEDVGGANAPEVRSQFLATTAVASQELKGFLKTRSDESKGLPEQDPLLSIHRTWSTGTEETAQLDGISSLPTSYAYEQDCIDTTAGVLVEAGNTEYSDEVGEPLSSSTLAVQNTDPFIQLDNQWQQDSVQGRGLVVEYVPEESGFLEDVTDEGRKSGINNVVMASDSGSSKVDEDAAGARQEPGTADMYDIHTDSVMYQLAEDKDSVDQITSSSALVNSGKQVSSGHANNSEEVVVAQAVVTHPGHEIIHEQLSSTACSGLRANVQDDWNTADVNGALAVSQTEEEADVLNNGRTDIAEDNPCSCGATMDFPTFHEETYSFEHSLSLVFQELQSEVDVDGHNDEHECSDAVLHEENHNENNNNVDKQLSDQVKEFLTAAEEDKRCDSPELLTSVDLRQSVGRSEKTCQTDVTGYKKSSHKFFVLYEDLKQTKEDLRQAKAELEKLNSKFSKLRAAEKALADLREKVVSIPEYQQKCKNLEEQIQQKEEQNQQLQQEIVQMEARIKEDNYYDTELLNVKQSLKEVQRDVEKKVSDKIQKTVSTLQKKLESAERELETKEAAAEISRLQFAAVEKELTERLQETEAQLQKSMQQNCSQDAYIYVSEELRKAQERATLAELQILQSTAVEKELTERLQETEAQLQKSLQQNCSQDVSKELRKAQERATLAELQILQSTAVEKELTERLQETEAQLQKSLQDVSKELGKAQERAMQAELQILQSTAVKKELTERLQETEAQLQKSLQQNCSQDVSEELRKAQERATQAELQILQSTAVEKKLTERLQETEAQLQKSMQQNCSQDVPEELRKAQERATQAELQVLNFTFRWCVTELEEQYREGERLYRLYTQRCMLGERQLQEFASDWQDYACDILKEIAHVQSVYSSNVQKLQSGQQLSSLPQLKLVRPRMPALPTLTSDMLTPPGYKLHLSPLPPVARQSNTGSPSPSTTTLLDTTSPPCHPQPVQGNDGRQDSISPQHAVVGNRSQESDKNGSSGPNLSGQNRTLSTQDNSTSQGRTSPQDNVQQPLKARPSEDSHSLRRPSGFSKAASIVTATGAVRKRRSRNASESSCSSNATEASVNSLASFSGPPGLINLQEPVMSRPASAGKSANKSSKLSPEVAANADMESFKTIPNKASSYQQETSQSSSNMSHSNQSASTWQGAAGQHPNLTPPPGYIDQSAGYTAAYPPGISQSASFSQGYAGQAAFSFPKQIPLEHELQFTAESYQFSSKPSGVFEFGTCTQQSPNVSKREEGAHPNEHTGKASIAPQPDKELKAPASFMTKTSNDTKTASFTQAVRPKSTIPAEKAKVLAKKALAEDALDTQNKFQALETSTLDTTEAIYAATLEAKWTAESDCPNETLIRGGSPVTQLSNVPEPIDAPEEENNDSGEEWQLQLSKKKKKVLSAVKESAAPQTSIRPATKVKLWDRLQMDMPGYSKEQLIAATKAVRSARHGTLSSLPVAVISTLVFAELTKSQPSTQVEQPDSQSPPTNQVQAVTADHAEAPPTTQVQAIPAGHAETQPTNCAAEAPPSTEAQDTATSLSCQPPSYCANNTVEVTEGNMLLARSLLQLKYKTEMCFNFCSSGTCPFGDRCLYAHGERELRSLPRLTMCPSMQQKLKYKTEMCFNFSSSGTCPYGDRCLYAHGERELRSLPRLTMCPSMQQKGHCPHGDSCIFAHSKADLQGSSKMPVKGEPASAVRTRTSATNRMRLVDLKKKQELADSFDKKRPLWQPTQNTRQTSQSLEADICAICVDDLYDLTGSCVRTLDCGHRFHDSCVSRWLLKEERTCPCCRQLALLPEEFPRLS